ncbi:hypothetical protein [Sphingomonas xinjiangensis]|uniref:Uncharacterized protein n=1 Tax=Sphingomonas xinjiangensis TaxID=643568 RepID=A0A840YSV8_9SPHN|nr:hypothetical protein [Sphingomonas xinjiangensis]MBB5712758.1 hypothetical protein [Sphingomonas xinjiangensis]
MQQGSDLFVLDSPLLTEVRGEQSLIYLFFVVTQDSVEAVADLQDGLGVD